MKSDTAGGPTYGHWFLKQGCCTGIYVQERVGFTAKSEDCVDPRRRSVHEKESVAAAGGRTSRRKNGVIFGWSHRSILSPRPLADQ